MRCPQGQYSRKLDGEQEARMVALVGSSPPEGYARWSLRLLADRVVQLKIIDSISHETVRQVLDDNELKLGLRSETSSKLRLTGNLLPMTRASNSNFFTIKRC